MSHAVSHISSSDIGSYRPEDRKLLWNDALESSFKELKSMVSAETLLSYPFWKLPFTFHIDASDKQLGAFISHNNKPIELFSRIFTKSQSNYIITKKEVILIVECLKQLWGIIFGYEINVFSYHNNLIYVATLIEYQRVMR